MEWKCNNHNYSSWFRSYNVTIETSHPIIRKWLQDNFPKLDIKKILYSLFY